MNNLDISVVIPVKNGQRYLDSVLQAIFFQEIEDSYEVIIIDSGSTDKTLDIAKKYPVKLYQIDEKEFNHGLTRNFGVSKTEGRYVILLTADAIPVNSLWMKKLVDSLKNDPEAAGVYSRHLPHQDSLPITRIRVKRFFVSRQARKESKLKKDENYNMLSSREKYSRCNFDNVSSAIRKSIWEKYPFPAACFAEDLEWAKEILKSGYKIIYQPDSLVYHSHDFSVFDWYEKNKVNSRKLYSLFGFKTADSFYKIWIFFLVRTFRDIGFLLKHRNQLKIFPVIFLIPIFSLSGILGEYKGISDFKRNR